MDSDFFANPFRSDEVAPLIKFLTESSAGVR